MFYRQFCHSFAMSVPRFFEQMQVWCSISVSAFYSWFRQLAELRYALYRIELFCCWCFLPFFFVNIWRLKLISIFLTTQHQLMMILPWKICAPLKFFSPMAFFAMICIGFYTGFAKYNGKLFFCVFIWHNCYWFCYDFLIYHGKLLVNSCHDSFV